MCISFDRPADGVVGAAAFLAAVSLTHRLRAEVGGVSMACAGAGAGALGSAVGSSGCGWCVPVDGAAVWLVTVSLARRLCVKAETTKKEKLKSSRCISIGATMDATLFVTVLCIGSWPGGYGIALAHNLCSCARVHRVH